MREKRVIKIWGERMKETREKWGNREEREGERERDPASHASDGWCSALALSACSLVIKSWWAVESTLRERRRRDLLEL